MFIVLPFFYFSYKKHVISRSPTWIGSGVCFEHLSVAFEQREAKGQPAGGLIGDGISPSRMIRFFAFAISGSEIGIADSKAMV